MKIQQHPDSACAWKDHSPRAMRRTAGVMLALFVGSGLFFTHNASAQSEGDLKTAIVTIDNFSFSPETLTIRPGTKVTFVNHDDIPHTIVAIDKSFKSKALDTDDSYEFTFTTSGSFDYFCGLHPHMKAKIVVAP
jgi:plastocyanin